MTDHDEFERNKHVDRDATQEHGNHMQDENGEPRQLIGNPKEYNWDNDPDKKE